MRCRGYKPQDGEINDDNDRDTTTGGRGEAHNRLENIRVRDCSGKVSEYSLRLDSLNYVSCSW